MPYITPTVTPVTESYWRIRVPTDFRVKAAIFGAILELTRTYNWENVDGVPENEMVTLFEGIYDEFVSEQNWMIGSLVHYVTNSPPNGVLACDGTQYLRVDYPILYADLPPSLIVDPDNFITPTIEDVFMLAAGTSYLPEDVGGVSEHTLTESEMPSHVHQSPYPNIAIDIKSVGSPNLESASNPPTYLPTQSTGGDSPHENMPPYVAWKVGIIAL